MRVLVGVLQCSLADVQEAIREQSFARHVLVYTRLCCCTDEVEFVGFPSDYASDRDLWRECSELSLVINRLLTKELDGPCCEDLENSSSKPWDACKRRQASIQHRPDTQSTRSLYHMVMYLRWFTSLDTADSVYLQVKR